ncbi:hypothetical protein PoB_005619100 [Plakobranchus ocellatus]|uniref:Uncharacterized protein n=1 Tax=Plakobranchus ocellatus TaxID=259542 RepID=A0AAV4CEB0_9GAST|nr:hypothetical protein PoB_005619100 [Plakobranchus ocellatus]
MCRPQERPKCTHPLEVSNPNGLDPPPHFLHRSDALPFAGLETPMDAPLSHLEVREMSDPSGISYGVRKSRAPGAHPAYTVKAQVGDFTVDAIVDTAAEITRISE